MIKKCFATILLLVFQGENMPNFNKFDTFYVFIPGTYVC